MTQLSITSPAVLDHLAYLGWPPVHTREIGPWVARAAGGVTRRANSVLTSPRPMATDASGTTSPESTTGSVVEFDVDAGIDAVEAFYREHGLPSMFQISDGVQPAGLADALVARGYRREGETLTQVASLESVRARLADSVTSADIQSVTITEEPDDNWLRMWWSVDGRAWPDEFDVARQIMGGSSAIYAAIHDEHGVSAGARMALLDEWGALFALVVRPNARRRGLATRVLAALVDEAERRGITRLCLQVLATSHGALAFYESLGFETASHYRYWLR